VSGYFDRLSTMSPSRVWVNNPTHREIGLALEQGAVGCTTNPAYSGGLVRRAPDYVTPIIDGLLSHHAEADDMRIADLVQEELVSSVAERFRPLHEESQGRWGYVSIQGSPENDTDGERIWEEAQAGRSIGPNVAPKIPATMPGLVAFERVVESGWPVIVTEVFSLDQVVTFCEAYLAITEGTGEQPRFFMSPITGILGDHLKKLAARDGRKVGAATMEQAGIGLARRCSALVAERSYPVMLLYGGARTPDDLCGLVGRPECATINWSTFAEILELDPPLTNTIEQPLDASVERELVEAFPDVWKGWEIARLRPEEYESFGPVQHFRDNFVSGWTAALEMIAERRAATAVVS